MSVNTPPPEPITRATQSLQFMPLSSKAAQSRFGTYISPGNMLTLYTEKHQGRTRHFPSIQKSAREIHRYIVSVISMTVIEFSTQG